MQTQQAQNIYPVPKSFQDFRETGPWLVTVACRTVLFLASLRRANASEPGERDTPCSFGPCRACLTLHARLVLCSPEKKGGEIVPVLQAK